MSQYAKLHSMLDNVGGPSACYLICIVLYVASELIWCTHMQGISAQRWGVHLPSSYALYYMSAKFVNIYADSRCTIWYARHLCSTDGGSICLNLTLVSECAVLYIYRSAIPLHVAVKLIWCTLQASMLNRFNWPSRYADIYIYRSAIPLHIYIVYYIYRERDHCNACSSKSSIVHNSSFDIT